MERLEGHQKQSINKYSKEEYTGSSKFEEIQEKCVQNKEKVDKYSKILSISLFFIFLFLISYHKISFYNNDFLPLVGLLSCIPSILFMIKNERIYSKIPAILGALLILIANVLAVTDSFFSNIFTSKFLIIYVMDSFFLWIITFFIHCIIVYILAHTIFKNDKIKYSAKIIGLEEYKGKNSHTYYAHFYDYTNKKNKGVISEEEYKTWKDGDYIETILQPQIDEITVKKIIHLNYFNGKTDMEIFQEKHKRDIELFGQSQEEMDLSNGNYKLESYAVFFLFIGFIDIIIWTFCDEYFETIMSYGIIYAITTTIALAITIYTSYREYSMINSSGKYTLEDMAIWKDFLVPRCLFYFFISFISIGVILSLPTAIINLFS